MSNVLEQLLGSISPAVAAQAASVIGEPVEQTQKSIGIATATLLAGLRTASHDAIHRDTLIGQLKDKANDVSILAHVGSLYASKVGTPVAALSEKMIATVFGAQRDSVTKEIAKASGISAGAAHMVLDHVTPHVMALLGRDLHAKGGLTGASLTQLLDAQAPHLASRLPSGVGSALGPLAAGAATTSTVADKVRGKIKLPVAANGFEFPLWLKWIAPIFALLLGSIWLLSGKQPTPVAQAPAAAPAQAKVVVAEAAK